LFRYRVETSGMWHNVLDMQGPTMQHPANTALWDAPIDKQAIKQGALWKVSESNPAATNMIEYDGRTGQMRLVQGPAMDAPVKH
ncbi:MAG TPA: hypothetical protein VG245_05310, partial [Candidatus Dormibacteraeota bacterium]|nr:hypothetical protein [Candidatus Dormibacteraeota bacterium]